MKFEDVKNGDDLFCCNNCCTTSIKSKSDAVADGDDIKFLASINGEADEYLYRSNLNIKLYKYDKYRV